MPAKTVKMLVTTVVLTAAFVGLLWGTLAEGTEYYMHVDEVMAEPDAWYGKKLQVHGFVVEDRGCASRTRWNTGSRSRTTAR